jgi:dihydrolipoamide dehydrogenase
MVVEKIAGKKVEPIKHNLVPNCTYCDPEVASVGLTEAKAIEAGYEVKVGKFPFSASGKARILGETDGFVKIVADKKYDEVLGVHIIGPHATELLAEACVGMALETTAGELGRIIHAHPTGQRVGDGSCRKACMIRRFICSCRCSLFVVRCKWPVLILYFAACA